MVALPYMAQAFLKAREGRRGIGRGISLCTVFQLSDVRGQTLSQGFTLSVLRLQEAWGCVLMLIK